MNQPRTGRSDRRAAGGQRAVGLNICFRIHRPDRAKPRRRETAPSHNGPAPERLQCVPKARSGRRYVYRVFLQNRQRDDLEGPLVVAASTTGAAQLS